MNQISRRQLFRAAGVLGGLTVAAGCTKTVSGSAVPVPHPTPPTPPPPPDNLAKARSAGSVSVLVATEDRPFAYQDSTAGLTGAAVEVVKAVFTALGIPRVTFMSTTYEQAQEKMAVSAASGGTDLVLFASGMIFHQDLCGQFDLVPDFAYLVAPAVKQGNPKGITSVNDLLRGSFTVATVNGPLTQQLVQAGMHATAIKQFPDPVSAGKAVAAGQADCFPYYDISLRELVTDKYLSGLQVVDGGNLPNTAPLVAGYQFPKLDDSSIKDGFAQKLASLHDEGPWLQTVSKFGLTASNQVPQGWTVDQLCQ